MKRFYELLISLDFKARRISARVYNEDNKYSPEFDHFTIIVNIDNVDYLCDVGFGEFIYEALKLDLGKIQIDPGGSYLLDSYKDGYLRISKVENGDPKPEFIFKDIERELDEFKAMKMKHGACLPARQCEWEYSLLYGFHDLLKMEELPSQVMN